jgi:O-antigen/teichoic acid export membrane protein
MSPGPLRRALGSRFLRDSTVLQLGSLSISGFGFLGTLALTHVLGAVRQGEFYLAVAAYSLLWFCLNLGLVPVTISQVARSLGEGREEDAGRWLGYLAKVGAPLAVLTFLAGSFGAPALLSLWVRSGEADAHLIGRCVGILSVAPVLELPRVVALAGLEGSRRMATVARIENGQELLRVVLVVSGALWTGDAVGPCVGTVIASLLGSLLALDLWARERSSGLLTLPPAREILRLGWRAPWGLGLRLGIKVGIIRNIDALGVQILPALILGRFASPRWVAYLRIALRLVDVGRLFMKGISRTALPVLSQLASVRDLRGLRRVYWRATIGSGVLIGAGLLATALVLRPALRSFLPQDYLHPVWVSFLILLPGTAVVGFSVANDTFYLVTGQLRMAIWISATGLVINTAVMVFACWRWPDYGAAAGLSFTFLWSLVHVSYAALWFRRHRATIDGAGGLSVAQA